MSRSVILFLGLLFWIEVAVIAPLCTGNKLKTATPYQGRTDGAAKGPTRQLQQGLPANCSAPSDTWKPIEFYCSLKDHDYSFTCKYDPVTGNALCHIQGPQPNQLIGMACPVKSGKAVCDLVVAQNFTDPEVVFSITALLAAWSPSE